MANLKDLRSRIKSVKSTQKITKAMKMVAASKLRRAQERAEAARPYAEKMERMLSSLSAGATGLEGVSPLLAGTGKDSVHLLILMTSDRGLCGGFNGSVAKFTRSRIRKLQSEGKQVKLLIVGKKGFELLRAIYYSQIVHRVSEMSKKQVEYANASQLADKVLAMFAAGEFDVCSVIYNRFQSAISQVVTSQQIIPLVVNANASAVTISDQLAYEYEPSEGEVLDALLPRNITVQLFRIMLESAASEQGARMTAMDNATRNAGDMIKRLTLVYNRTRQAAITKELIEIISGAQAV